QRSRLGESGLYYAAQARFLQAEELLRQYEAIQIAGPTEGLRQRLEQKSELLRRAAEAFAGVVQLNVAEWVTAALFQIGRSYELYAEGLRSAPIPEGLSEEEEMAYTDQLSSFIVPIEERALEAYEGGYQTALELRIFNRWTARLREGLTRLNDVQYPPLREMGGELADSAAIPVPGFLDGLRRGAPEAERPAAVEGGYRPGPRLRISNGGTPRLREGLTRLNAVQYPPLREMGGELADSAAIPVPGFLDGLRRGAPEAERPAAAVAAPESA